MADFPGWSNLPQFKSHLAAKNFLEKYGELTFIELSLDCYMYWFDDQYGRRKVDIWENGDVNVAR